MFLSFSRFFMVTNAEWVVWFQKISRRFTTVCVSCVRSLCIGMVPSCTLGALDGETSCCCIFIHTSWVLVHIHLSTDSTHNVGIENCTSRCIPCSSGGCREEESWRRHAEYRNESNCNTPCTASWWLWIEFKSGITTTTTKAAAAAALE